MRVLLLALCALVGAAGCARHSIVPVSGKVTLDGKPLVRAIVIFQPESEELNPGPGSQGRTDTSGEFTLQLMTKDVKGAMVGRHKVSITAYEGDDTVPSSGSDIVFRKPLLPPEYNSETKLRFDVPAAGTTAANFDLKSAPPTTATK
jgi:hypothetical protein